MSNSDKRGSWTIKSAKSIYENAWIRLVHHEVLNPKGGDGHYGVVEFHNLAIGVLPIDADGNVQLVGQHRFPGDYYSWELPEGGGAKDEPPIEAAKRELSEETGLTARNWLEYFTTDLSNAVTDEIAIGFIAWDLQEGVAHPEDEEEIARRKLPFAEAYEMAYSGEIRDTFSQGMLFKAKEMAVRQALPNDLCALILS